MHRYSKKFYVFLTFHCFLLGLFPFFLPVYLFKQGNSLASISWFIALTGLGFIVSLFFLDHARAVSLQWFIGVSFIIETVLLGLVAIEAPLPLLALVNGSYSCLYWTIQRVLFLAAGSSRDSGRRFGNFQIYVFVILKVGIFFGSILLQNSGLIAIIVVSVAVGCLGGKVCIGGGSDISFPIEMQKREPLTGSDVIRFRDGYNSKIVFAIDGMYLYLESYFWLITLFLIVGENYFRLGVMVILLAIVLGILFYLIKNRIDQADKNRIYVFSVSLYVMSWILRAWLDAEMGYSTQLCLILVISFCTSFFRLAFNKRFFDIAESTSDYRYLFVKSYYSQLFLVVGFGIVGALVTATAAEVETVLEKSYWAGAVFGLLYLFYLPACRHGVQKQT